MGEIEIRYVDWGLANNFTDYIEVHKDLVQYPELLKQILEHERNHNDKGLWYNLKVDFFPKENIKRMDILRFMLKRPKTWIQMLPFYYQPSKGFVYDNTKILLWLILLAALTFDIVALLRIS